MDERTVVVNGLDSTLCSIEALDREAQQRVMAWLQERYRTGAADRDSEPF